MPALHTLMGVSHSTPKEVSIKISSPSAWENKENVHHLEEFTTARTQYTAQKNSSKKAEDHLEESQRNCQKPTQKTFSEDGTPR